MSIIEPKTFIPKTFAGSKESQFYTLPFEQAVASMY